MKQKIITQLNIQNKCLHTKNIFFSYINKSFIKTLYLALVIFTSLLAIQCGGGGGGGGGGSEDISFTLSWDSSFSNPITVTTNQTISALAIASPNTTILKCIASNIPQGLKFEKINDKNCLLSGTFIEPKATTNYTFSASSSTGKLANLDLSVTVNCLSKKDLVNGFCPFSFSYPYSNYLWATNSNVNISAPSLFFDNVAYFEINPALPAWLSLNTATGAFSGRTLSIVDKIVYNVTATSVDNAKATVNLGIGVVPDIASNKDDLIEITTIEQLNNIRNSLDGKAYVEIGNAPISAGCTIPIGGTSGVCKGYKLKNNLNFAGTRWARDCTGANCVAGGWPPIGTDSTSFSATFNGNGFTIQNLYINRPNLKLGFFASTSSDASISNLGLTNIWVSSGGTGGYAGGMVGYSEGTVTLSYASGSVSGNGNNSNTGGLVGNQYGGSISNSYASCSVSWNGDNTSIGGLVGSVDGDIRNSYARGSVTLIGIDTGNAGGLVGKQINGTITYTYAKGSVTTGDENATNINTGGLVGSQSNGGTITKSYATGLLTVFNTNYGSLLGNKNGGNFSNNYYDVTTTLSNIESPSIDTSGKPLTTIKMQTMSGATNDDFPGRLNFGGTNCFKLTDGSYPKLFTWDGSACTTTVLGGQ